MPDSGGKLIVVFRRNHSVACWLEDDLGGIVLTFLVSGFVRVVRRFHDSILNDVIVGFGKVATVASFVTVFAAIDYLLFREIVKGAFSDGIDTFQARDCAEGPAGTTLSLILNFVDFALCSPVDGAGGAVFFEVLGCCAQVVLFVAVVE